MFNGKLFARFAVAAIIELALVGTAAAAGKPVPPSPYLPLVYRYADALLQNGRDNHGPQKTGLVLSVLDRKTLTILTERPAAPPGIDEPLRAGPGQGLLAGCNP